MKIKKSKSNRPAALQTEFGMVEKMPLAGEELHKALVEAAGRAGIGIVILQDIKNKEGAIISANQQACDIAGYSQAEALRLSINDVVPADILKRILLTYRKRQQGKIAPNTYEAIIIRKDKARVPVIFSLATAELRGKMATVVYIRDIRKNKLAEEALHQSENFLNNIIENIPNMIFVKDAETLKFVRLNKAGEDLLGHSRKDLIGKSDYDFFPKKQADFFISKDREMIKGKKLVDIPEEPIKTASKGDRILHTKKLPVFDEAGKPKYLLGISEDITDSKRAEEILHQSEERFRKIFEEGPLGMITVGPDMHFLSANDTFCKMVGYTEAELKKMTFADITHPDYRDRDVGKVKSMLAGKIKRYQTEKQYIRKDKTFIWVFITVTIIKDEQGKLLYFLTMIDDISERKQSEMALQQSEQKFKAIFNNATDGVLLMDVATKKFADANMAICKMLGYGKSEIEKLEVADIHSKKDLAYVLDQVDQLIKGKIKLSKDIPVKRKDGSIFYADISASEVKLDGKSYLLGIFRDTTERKQAESELNERTVKLNEAKAKAEALLASIGDGVIATNSSQQEKIVLMNKAAENMLGWRLEDVIDKPVTEVIVAEDENGNLISKEKRPIFLALSSGAITAATTAGPSYYYVRKDGSKFPVAITVSPMVLNNKIVGAVEVFRDITLEKEIDKEKSEFVSLASHQLRTPTTAINWYAEMLLKEEVGPLNQEQKKYMREVYHGNQRMIDLVNALLTVSRIDLGTFAIEPKTINVKTITDDVLHDLQTQIAGKAITVNKEYEKNIPAIVSDPTLVGIIFQNIIANAIEYSPSKGSLGIKISRASSGVVIKVSDKGCGIPAEARSKIFEKFFRADNAISVKPDGNGLGLYITKSITEALGGTIGFESVENKGTAFSVWMPFKSAAKRQSKKKLI